MLSTIKYFIIFICCILVSCAADHKNKSGKKFIFPYHLEIIEDVWLLPDELHEISGMVALNDSIMVCVNDENGILFNFNLNTAKTDTLVVFGPKGDYEGLAYASPAFYVVSSSGTIFIIDQNLKTGFFLTPLNKHNDIEGICYLPAINIFLLAAKGSPVAGIHSNLEYKSVFAFDPVKKKTGKDPFFTIDAQKQADNKKKNKFFSPSDIAFDPVDSVIYCISAHTHQIMVSTTNGQVLYLEELNKNDFIQPEGICFDRNYNLYISTEGKKNPARIYRFRREKIL